MPFLIALAAAAVGIYFFLIRARNTAHMVGDLADTANDVRLAARRFGFRRASDQHPVDALDDQTVALGAIGAAFLELDDLPTREQRDALVGALAQQGGMSRKNAEESLILGRWIVGQSGGPAQAIPRLSKRLFKLAGSEPFLPLMAIIKAVSAAGSGDLTQPQKSALEDIRLAFRIS